MFRIRKTECRRLRYIIATSFLIAIWFCIHTVVSVFFGCADQIKPADLIVVFGNAVKTNGMPSQRLQARLDKAADLYNAQYAPLILVSGGKGKEGFEESAVMRDYLMTKGIPASVLLVDTNGYTSYLTVKAATQIVAEKQLPRVLFVTHYYHALRADLTFRKFGAAQVYRAHASMGPELREPFSLIREFAGYYYYAFRSYPDCSFHDL